MPESEEDDFDALPEGELLTLPDGAIPPGWLTEFFARRPPGRVAASCWGCNGRTSRATSS